MEYVCNESANFIESYDVDFSINDPSDLVGMVPVILMGVDGWGDGCTVSHTRPRYI